MGQQVFDSPTGFNDYSEIENLRRSLFRNAKKIQIDDHGAGSLGNLYAERRISEIAKRSLSSRDKSIKLARLAQHIGAKKILELGTSLGINALYLAKHCPNAEITTVEGSKSIYDLAKQHFDTANTNNIIPICGTFDDVLPALLHEKQFDLIFLDGDHRFETTIRYVNAIFPYLKSGSVVVLDDIHWSKEMSKAWAEIIDSQKFTYSIDMYYQGWLFILDGTINQEFTVRW